MSVTRAGRAIKAPTTYEPAQAPSPGKGKGKRAAKKESSIVCVKCHRGSSPSNNQIVFCDGCNDTWHQKCHDPPIDDYVVLVASAGWWCSKCRPVENTVPAPEKESVPRKRKNLLYPRLGPPRVINGSEYSVDARRKYLSQLSHAELAELALKVSMENPDVAMFPVDMESFHSDFYSWPRQHGNTNSVSPGTKKRQHEHVKPDEEVETRAKRPRTTSAQSSKPLVSTKTRAQSVSAVPEPEVGPAAERTGERTAERTAKAIAEAQPKAKNARSKNGNAKLLKPTLDGSQQGEDRTSGSPSKSVKSDISDNEAIEYRQYPKSGDGYFTKDDFIEPETGDEPKIIQEAWDCATFSHSLHGAAKEDGPSHQETGQAAKRGRPKKRVKE
ncbi:hypothetical protein N7466_000137 [Penicillium verhagenii]|uniref:uncharacterized protein n=1 Tax=Penicillium verhagenii TaxID=1562060 RepID=UPI002544F2BC|nr:uncharacterized protein N7466_000137 [Penicillium verhagenii]KAJ5947122.1 hypothetical protein N7466_000137 [Penicillium verhagenii]